VSGSASEFAFVRIQQTLVGVLVATVIHNVVLPIRASRLVHAELILNLGRIKNAFAFSFASYQKRVAGEEGARGRNNVTEEQAPRSATNERQSDVDRIVHDSIVLSAPPPAVPVPLSSPGIATSPGLPSPSDWVEPPRPAATSAESAAASSSSRASSASTSSSSSPALPPVSASGNGGGSAHVSHELDPAHSFTQLAPKLIGSLSAQSSLILAASDELRLWRPPFPSASYTAVIELQRSISLHLFCMDVSLQRMLQSHSRYVMPNQAKIFTRLHASVLGSLSKIMHGLQVASSPRGSPAAVKNNTTASSTADGRADTAASGALSADSSAASLLSLHASLEELDQRYKRWIDSQVLAQRHRGRLISSQQQQRVRVQHQLQQQHQLQRTNSLMGQNSSPMPPQKDVGIKPTEALVQPPLRPSLDSSTASAVEMVPPSRALSPRSAAASGLGTGRGPSGSTSSLFIDASTADAAVESEDHEEPLALIPLFTPQMVKKQMGSELGDSLDCGIELSIQAVPLQPTPAPVAAGGTSSSRRRRLSADTATAAAAGRLSTSTAPAAVFGGALSPSSNRSCASFSSSPSSASVAHVAASDLEQLALTLTRSMDVLALNTFLYAARGSDTAHRPQLTCMFS
jgi:hypothetical protein